MLVGRQPASSKPQNGSETTLVASFALLPALVMHIAGPRASQLYWEVRRIAVGVAGHDQGDLCPMKALTCATDAVMHSQDCENDLLECIHAAALTIIEAADVAVDVDVDVDSADDYSYDSEDTLCPSCGE
ncbi:uncharacterized protein SPSK_06717 [Sporothrix schenckii 1099-18]|uniref:Uncharacterized protein n=1 Tax=Sporothrix schenckii 1099-18 TaxID=1397361 RepID=A0A0F2MJX8_SPOSC|nr:uncharacterized protein SPSK_06717 [Sporothrix schenckii 1099-18]KJR89998.1 hypothetical protein SPSK_06717 [Sporothrix schenckii 1099-18]